MSFRIRLKKVSLTIHNWVGLLIAIQFFFWCLGGVVMSVLPIELVRGEVNMVPQVPISLKAEDLAKVIAQIGEGEIKTTRVKSLAGKPVVELETIEGKKSLYDVASSQALSPITTGLAEQIAVADYAYRFTSTDTLVPVQSVKLLSEEPGDFRRRLPVWQVSLADPDGTRIYVAPDSGDVIARRNDYWRVYDFFWMLHIMDYETRDDFNNPVIIFASITSTLFVITGFILLYFRFGPSPKRRKNQ